MADHPSTPPARPQVRSGGVVRSGTRAGDQRIRLSRRPAEVHVALPRPRAPKKPWPPALLFVSIFAGLVVAGTVLLSLPIAGASGEWTAPLDALFTSTSAVCLTGLVVLDTGTHWSPFGLTVILALIQLGGIGFMTSSTILLVLVGYSVSLRQRVLLREALGGGTLGSVVSLGKRVVVFTLVAELIGTAILSLRFLTEMDPAKALWWGLFHAVSGFNNAGFDLIGGFRSVSPYSGDATILLTLALLMLFGALSYTAMEDLFRQRRFVRLTLDTKLVLVTTLMLTVAGTVGLLFTERANLAGLGGMEPGTRVLNAFFQTATRTGGYSSIDIGRITQDGLIVMMVLMFIGGATGSTAGGIKVQTFSLLFFSIVSSVRGRPSIEAFRRRIPTPLVMRALSIALLALAFVFTIFFALSLTESFAFERVLFEAVSAFSTVGLSTGITHETSAAGRVILIVAMFAGRLGPLTLAFAFAARERATSYEWPEEPVKIG